MKFYNSTLFHPTVNKHQLQFSDSGRKSAADCLPPPPPPPEDEDIHEEDNHEGPNANNLVTSTSNKSNSASRLSNSSGMLVAS